MGISVSTDPRVGSEFLGYWIEALLGRGGMGVVYRAHHVALDRKVALKLLAPELAADERFRERFLRESRLAASLDHPSIVPVHDAGEVEGQLYIAMRYVEGSDLKHLLREQGALEPRRALQLLGQLAHALDFAHARGLVHRDVKPSNALLDLQEHLYLADFGLTKSASDRSALTATGRVIGTVDYAAPEQIEGKAVDGRADVYSLGCLLYECLAGDVPFRRDSELAALWAHVNEPPPKLASYPALNSVVAKALAKDPSRRYASCSALVDAARDALGLRDVVIVRDRRPLLLAVAGAALAVAAVLSAFFLTGGGGARKLSTKPTVVPKIDSLQRIDPATNRLVATIAPGADLAAVAVGEGAVWATGERDGSLRRIDPATDTVSATGSAGPAAGGPSYPAAGGGAVWVSNPGQGGVTQIDPGTLRILQTFIAGGTAFNCGPIGVGYDAVWAMASDRLYRVSPDGLIFGSKIPAGCPQPGGLAAGEGAVWVASDDSPEVLRVDPRTLRVIRSVPLAFLPTQVAVGAGGVWLVDRRDDAVVEVDPRTNRVVAHVKVGRGPDGIAVGQRAVWVANVDSGTVSRIDPRTARVIATIEVGPNPSDVAAGEGAVWVLVHPP